MLVCVHCQGGPLSSQADTFVYCLVYQFVIRDTHQDTGLIDYYLSKFTSHFVTFGVGYLLKNAMSFSC